MNGSAVTRLCVLFQKRLSLVVLLGAMALWTPSAANAQQESLCDNSFEDCRTRIINLIQNETVGLDVSFWFMTDTSYSAEIIRRWRAGVPVRVLVDLRADTNYPSNANVRQSLINAGIPIRHKTTTGINHWKMMLYAGQNTVHFSAANFSSGSYSPTTPYTNYVDEAVYFTSDPAVVQTFMTKYDDLWTNTTHYANLANINTPLSRNYETFPLDPAMNFPPDQDYQDRLVGQMRLETQQIDVSMFRITSGKGPDELLRRHAAGVPIRIITDKDQYRNTTYFWHSYNIDRMYAAGIPVKWRRDDAMSDEDMHQKSVVLYSRDLAAFGSSNWTASSSDTQREHNYFTGKDWFVQWFKDQFERKWNNVRADGAPMSPEMYLDFVPGFPESPVYSSPANAALGLGSSVTLRWEGGYWAHKYDIYFGTASTPPLVVEDYAPGSATAGVSSSKESYTFTNLQPGVTYYWRIRSKTMANRAVQGPTYSFTTSGGAPIPAAPTGLSAVATSSTRVALSWTDVASEEGYKVERKLSSSSTWTQIGLTTADTTAYTDFNSGLTAGTGYNYRVRAYTTGGNSGYSNIATVTTPFPQVSSRDVVLYASEAPVRVGSWAPVADTTAAGGSRLNNTNAGAAAVSTAQVNPAHYFEMTFTAPADVGFRLWIRGKAYNDSGYNDSVHVQFSDSLSSPGGSAAYRIGTTSGTYVNLAEAAGETIQAWGWQDNGFGAGVLGPLVYFANSGTHTIRVQVREDGFSIDQIVLSPDTFLDAAPGANKLDSTKLPKQNGAAAPPLPASEGRVVADTYVRGGPYASTSFGAMSELVVKFSTAAEFMREAHLKLDISDVQPGDTVRLRLFGRLSDTRAATVTTHIYAVASTSWVETSLTWNNRPASETTMLGTIVVAGTTSQWYEVDLTSYVQARRLAGASVISIALKNPVDTLPYISFNSRESGTRPEFLIVN